MSTPTGQYGFRINVVFFLTITLLMSVLPGCGGTGGTANQVDQGAVMDKLKATTTFRSELLNLPTTITGSGASQASGNFYVPGNATKLGASVTIPIKWAGTSFSGGNANGLPDRLSGSVSYSNGKVLVSFDYATNDPADNLKISVVNLPVDPKDFMSPPPGFPVALTYSDTNAPTLRKYITTLEWTSHKERVMGTAKIVSDAALSNAD